MYKIYKIISNCQTTIFNQLELILQELISLVDEILFQNMSIKRPNQPVPWIKVNQNREPSEKKTECGQINLVDKVKQTLI